MKREEIEQAIKNGESVWCVYKDQSNIYEIKAVEIEKVLSNTFLWGKEYYANIKDVYKTKAEAEHYLHHANVTRTETLPFLTWEEFSKINIKDIEFTDKKLNLYNLSGFGKIKLYRNIDTADETLLLELEATEENFYKAYDECVRLFKGEE